MSDRLRSPPVLMKWYIDSVKAPKNTPSKNIFIDLRIILFFDDDVPLFFLESTIETPTINMKNGYTKSVSVIPFQSACRRGENVLLQLPGLFTIIIKAIVRPLKTSTDNNLLIQIYEDSDGPKMTKLYVVDAGVFNDPNDPNNRTRKRVFYVGKVFFDTFKVPTFINIFTIIMD